MQYRLLVLVGLVLCSPITGATGVTAGVSNAVDETGSTATVPANVVETSNETITPTSTSTPTPTATPTPTPTTGDCQYPYRTTDATGTAVTVPGEPDRVVTLAPSAAQTMWEIGAKEKVVGVSKYATYLEGASSRTNVSAAFGPDVEAVIGTDPDLVLVPNSTNSFASDRVETIRDAGIPVYVFGTGTSLEFVAEKTERIGRLTGECDAGEERADEMRESIRQMRIAVLDEPEPTGLNLFYGYTSGENTFIGNAMETAGLENGAAAAGISGFRKINAETVVAMDPAWIVQPAGSTVPETEAYQSTTAVQSGQIVTVNPNYIQQPAPRVVLAMETILEAVHPDAYHEYETGEEPDDGDDEDDVDESTPAPPDETSDSTESTLENDRPAVEVAPVANGSSIRVTIRNASANEPVVVDLTNDSVESPLAAADIAIEQFTVTYASATDARLTVSIADTAALATRNGTAPPTPGTEEQVVGAVRFEDDAAANVSQLIVTFRVDAAGSDGSQPRALYRYRDGELRQSNTTALGPNRYRVTTPALSTVVVKSNGTATETRTQAPTSTAEPETNDAVTTATATATVQGPTASPTADATATSRTETTTPGFGLGVAAFALLATMLAATRRH